MTRFIIVVRNERLDPKDRVPVGYFTFYEGQWVLVNQKLEHMKDLTEKKEVPINEMVILTPGKKLLLSAKEGGRLVLITITNENNFFMDVDFGLIAGKDRF